MTLLMIAAAISASLALVVAMLEARKRLGSA
jgi:hypothetical protein